jgi:ribonuclease D
MADDERAEVPDPAPPPGPEAPLLREPSGGVPDPIENVEELRQAAAALASGSGPIAIDAERASGYRYSQRAYLVQLRRAGAGTVLVDPLPLGAAGFTALAEVVNRVEWIVHAASQDLPCLAELGLRPPRLFDTELAGRLLGAERVALGTMVEQWLGVRLEKGHSAADWSTRPLPHDWLAYAALDVELLIPLWAILADRLADAGKGDWADQEFDAVRTAPPGAPREDPWRRTSGIHGVRNRRGLAVVRSLWYARDAWAAERDVAPGRVLPDAAIVAAARAHPAGPDELAALGTFRGPRQRRAVHRWWSAVEAAAALPDAQLPTMTGRGDGMPPAGRWRERDPAAVTRLAACREVVSRLAAEHEVLAQNLLAGDVVRRLAWQPPDPLGVDAVGVALAGLGARPWQVALTAAPLAAALQDAAVQTATRPADPAETPDDADPPAS